MQIPKHASAFTPAPLRRVGVRLPAWISYQRIVFDGVLEFMRAHEAWVIETPVDSSGELAPMIIDEHWRGDGLIVFRYTGAEAAAWQEAGIPVVNLSTERLDGPFPSVVPDNFGGGAEAARHLLTLGLRDFAFVGRATAFVDDDLTGLGCRAVIRRSGPKVFSGVWRRPGISRGLSIWMLRHPGTAFRSGGNFGACI